MKIKKTTETLKFHDLSDVFPAMVEWSPRAHNLIHTDENEAWAEFLRDVRVNGQREPIVLLDGAIIDGRHRYLACRSLGIPVQYVEATGDPLALVLSLNLHRRHLTGADRAAVYLRIRQHTESDRPVGDNQHTGGASAQLSGPSETARAKAAAKAGISESTAGRIDLLDDEAKAEVVAGTKSVNKALTEQKEREAKATAKKAKKGSTASQQKVINPLLAKATKHMEAAQVALEAALAACDEYGWTNLDQSPRDELSGWTTSLIDTLNALPWGKEK